MNELIDIINERNEVIGQANVDEIHQKGLLHRSIHIFIIDSKERLFCRQRNPKKERYPGYWSTSVGAHVMMGQTYNQVAHESLKNTLGIDCELKMIGKVEVCDKLENEISTIYVGYSNEKMNFNINEIREGEYLTIDEMKRLIKQNNVTPHLKHSLEVYLNYRRKPK